MTSRDRNDVPIPSIRESYDQLAEEYANHLFHELENKPFDRELLDRFAAGVSGLVCDMGCGPGHVASEKETCWLLIWKRAVSPAGSAGLLRSRKKHISDQSYDDLIISILPERDDPYCGAGKQTVAKLYKSVKCSLPLAFTSCKERQLNTEAVSL
jgi:hypothetical protein